MEEAEKRDHRKKQHAALDLFHMQEEAPGMVFWHPNGWVIWQQVEQYMRRVYARQRLSRGALPSDPRPQPVGEVGPLAELQGADVHHGVGEARLRDQADELPGHLQIYNKGLHSPRAAAALRRIRRLPPQRAFGGVARIMRIRGFTQDDGHIFCTEEIQPEVMAFSALLKRVYTDSFTEILSASSPRARRNAWGR